MQAGALEAKAVELIRPVLRMTTKAGAGHPSSALSLAHLVTVLMYHEMRYDPADPWNPLADRLVLSEGHAVPIIYAAYADLEGTVGKSPGQSRPLHETDSLRDLESTLDGHPNPAEGFPFFDAATGSLGMGLSVAAGMALAANLDGSERRIYCVIGDGESREGQISEALDFIVDHNLHNVCAIFNCNGEGQAGKVSVQQQPQALQRKLSAYGWEAQTIDGHNTREIIEAFDQFHQAKRPFATIARTVKGWGVDALQAGNFHGKPLPSYSLAQAWASLEQRHQQQGTTPADARGLHPPKCDSKPPLSSPETIALPPFRDALARSPFAGKDQLATRRAYGLALDLLGTASDRIVALDGDVSNSTFSELFAANHRERFFECKIAEQNMLSTAVGLARAGKIPFVNSFGKFIARAYDQVELAIISRANVKIVGSHSGLGPASDGPSQMSLADVAFFRSYSEVDDGTGKPACIVFQPADAVAAYRCTELMARTAGLCYMRTHRPDTPLLYPPEESFEVGGCKILKRGDALTLVATGATVSVALEACSRLATEGILCTLIDAYSLPLAPAPILQAAESTKGCILSVEDNYAGGFGSAVAEIAAREEGYTVQQLMVRSIPKSARTPEQLMAHYGLCSNGIVQAVREYLR